MARHPFSDTTPPRLPDYLAHWAGLPECDQPSDIRAFLSLYQRATQKTPFNRPKAAFEVYKHFEFGILPVVPDRSEAIAWCKYASSIGSKDATLRLFLKTQMQSTKHELLGVLIQQTAADVGQGLKSYDSEVFRLVVARHAMDNVSSLKPKQLKAVLHILNGLDDGESDDIRRRINVHLGRQPKKDGPLHQVALGKIQGDSDFKVGIYKALEQLLPLRKVPSDLDGIEMLLNFEFPWFADANKAVMRQLRVRAMSRTQALHMKPLLLVGLPGLGKTTWARRLAELLDVPFRVVMAGGSSDSMFLRGTARGWSSARPGAVIETIAVEQVANPLIVVDELDKASPSNRNGRIWDVLLQLLEPASSKAFLDECLGVPADISKVSWIATANSLNPLPEPLLNRFTVVLVKPPCKEDLLKVAESVRRQMAMDLEIDQRMIPHFSGEQLDLLAQCKDPREVARVAREMLENGLLARRRSMH